MFKLGIVDDHASIRDSYKKAIESDGDYEVLGSMSSASLAELWCLKYEPDLMLMDICTEGEVSGLDATKMIKSSCPNVKIIIMTGFDEIS